MSTTTPTTTGGRRLAGVAVALLLTASLTACSALPFGGSEDTPAAQPEAAATAAEPIDSQFTRDGTFQSHLGVPGVPDVDFVYTLYPTKATPRTNEWYPGGKKYFSFTFTAYDLAQGLRDPFATKRKVYLETIDVTSRTVTEDGPGRQQPYELSAVGADVTFDPEPLTTPNGMLVSSPKGALELRNQAIGAVPQGTTGVELTFRAVVNVQTTAGGTQYVQRTVTQKVPIGIFASDEPTRAARIPINAN
jgi:hypothetical protein